LPSSEQPVEFNSVEADKLEVERERLEVGEFGGEQVLVPAGVERDLLSAMT